MLLQGGDATIIATGAVLPMALEAAKALRERGTEVSLIDMHTVKPLDVEAVRNALKKTRAVLTVEDHNVINGLGSAVSEVAAEYGGALVRRMGVQDRFSESGPYLELLKKNGVSVQGIITAMEEMLFRQEA